MKPSELTILAVDDQPDIVRLVQLYFERAEFNVVTANDGVVALEMARKHKPDVIILDIIMPKMNGVEVLRTLKADPELKAIPVFILTVKSDSSTIIEVLREGAERHLPKPFHPKELVAIVTSYFESLSREIQHNTEIVRRS